MNKHAVDILLVEDDRRLADLTAEYFELNAFSVAIESRGDQALSHFAKVKPRAVLLDLMLPGADGLDDLPRTPRDLRRPNPDFHGT